jgi:hypothetical protein
MRLRFRKLSMTLDPCGTRGESIFMRLAILFLLTTSSSLWAQSPAPAAKEKSCREHPQLIGSCFTIRGRLSIYNGAPALRLWRVGSRRMLGISEQRFAVAGYRNVPDYIESQINQNLAIFGDFMVCPFTRSQPGAMQLVCIETGKNLVVRKQK